MRLETKVGLVRREQEIVMSEATAWERVLLPSPLNLRLRYSTLFQR